MECSICFEFFASSDVVVATCCGHMFHKLCIDRWKSHSRSCPMCREWCVCNYIRLYPNFGTPAADKKQPKVDAPKGSKPKVLPNFEPRSEQWRSTNVATTSNPAHQSNLARERMEAVKPRWRY